MDKRMFVMKMKRTFLALVLVSSAFSVNVLAADIEAGVVNKIAESSTSLAINSPSSMSDEYIEASSDAKISSRAAASGITYFEIGNIYSSNYGWENITPSQSSSGNHGGATLNIYIWQFGYGNVTNATMNGISKSAGLSEYRCGNDLHVCAVGETVTGWLYGFDFSGQQSGSFSVGSNSTVSPFGYWSDSIYIN
jgi:hypothetical protein